MESSPTLAEVSANHIRQSSPNAICLCSWVHGAAPHGNIDLSGPFRVVGVCVGLHRRAIVAEQCGPIHVEHGFCAIVCQTTSHATWYSSQYLVPCAIGVVHMWRITYGSLRMAHMAQRGRHRHSYPQDPTTMLICHLDAYFYPNKCQYRQSLCVRGNRQRGLKLPAIK